MDMDYGFDSDCDVTESESLDGNTEPIEVEAITTETLEKATLLETDIPEMTEAEQMSFREFEINEAIENGTINEAELRSVEEQSLAEINDAMNAVEKSQDIPSMSKSEVEWYIEEGNLSADELGALKTALETGVIEVKPDEMPEEPEGIARVRRK